MRVAVFSTKPYDESFFREANARYGLELAFHDTRLTAATASLAAGCYAVCAFVNDDLSAPVVNALADIGVRTIALRCAGFNQVDLAACRLRDITVTRVPAYSPHAVAEHTIALILAVNRNLHRACNRVRESNFSLDGLTGFDMAGKTAGVIGTGKIGAVVARILTGFGCRVLAYDVYPDPDLNVEYTDLDRLLRESDIVTLHVPLLESTYHMIDAGSIAKMKRGVTLANTSRGGLLDTPAVIEALKSGQIGRLALDVYEEEASLFFDNRSAEVLQDDIFARLLTFPNVIITGHQAFLTHEALTQIAQTTLANIQSCADGTPQNQVE